MNRYDLMNGVAFLCALGFSCFGVLSFATQEKPATVLPALEPDTIERFSLEDGTLAIKDARGNLVPIRDYQKIMSLGIVSDSLLAELCEPQRLVAVSSYTRGPSAIRLSGIKKLDGLNDLEAIIANKPDIVFVSSSSEELDRLARLREAGITICDLGSQGGVATLIPNAQRIGALLKVDKRAQQLVQTFTWRLHNVSASLPADQPRRKALYLGVFGKEIYGGTVGSSFHDILTAAGLIDVAAEQHHGWPAFSLEQIIQLNPDVIVLSPTSATALQAIPGARVLRALQQPNGLIIIKGELLEDSGPRLLEAAEAVFRAAYPPRNMGEPAPETPQTKPDTAAPDTSAAPTLPVPVAPVESPSAVAPNVSEPAAGLPKN